MNATKRVLAKNANKKSFYIIVWELMRNDFHDAALDYVDGLS